MAKKKKTRRTFPNFRTIISEMIAEKNTDIAKLARKADVGYATVYNFVRHGSNISIEKLTKLFDTLNSM